MTEDMIVEMVQSATIDNTAIIIAVISSGVVTVLLTAIMAFVQHKANKKDTLSTEYRQKKDKALDELLNDFYSLNNPESSPPIYEIALIPRLKCPARKINEFFVPISIEFLESKVKLNEYENNLNTIISKHQFWFSYGLNQAFHYYSSYLSNLRYICMLDIIKPNKLLAFLLSFDCYSMQLWINRELHNCYFGKHELKYKSLFNKQYIKKFKEFNKKQSLGSLILMTAENEMKDEYKKLYNDVRYEESDFYKHYSLCVSCNLECPLAKQDFVIKKISQKKKPR